MRVIMATGDGLLTAKSEAAKLGIDEVYGEVKHADKLELLVDDELWPLPKFREMLFTR